MERMEIDAMRQIPLADFLARLGNEPVRRSGNELWYRAPYRNERTPSFRVNVAKQLWYDFGLDKGGDIFTLAGEFIGSNDFMEQVKFIAETANIPMPVPEVSRPTFLPKPSEPVFEGVEAAPLFRFPPNGLSGGTGHSLRHCIPVLLPTELRCAWQAIFRRRFSEYGGRF